MAEWKKNAGNRGFAISIDALLATVLVLGVITFIGFGMQPGNEAITPAEMSIKQAVDDTFTVLENSGVLAAKLVDEPMQNPAESIFEAAQKLVPENTGMRVEITEYNSKPNLAECKNPGTRNFGNCFEAQQEMPFGETAPEDREVFHGRIISMSKSLGVQEGTQECQVISAFEEKKETRAMLEGEPEKAITTEIEVTDVSTGLPLTGLECSSGPDDHQARVTMKIKNDSRDPVAIALVMDKSGSMDTKDMLRQEKSGSFNSSNCTSQGSAWVSGQIPGHPELGNALNLNGNISAMFGNPAALQLTGDMTIAFWAKPTNKSWTEYQNLICRGQGGSIGEFCLLMANGYLWYGQSTNGTMLSSMFNNDVWVHVTVTRSAGLVTVYKNAQALNWGNYPTPSASSYPLKIGGLGYSTARNFAGVIDEVRIYNRALNGTEISNVYNNTAIPTNGLVSYWNFNQSEGSIVQDNSGNGNNGTVDLCGYYSITTSNCSASHGNLVNLGTIVVDDALLARMPAESNLRFIASTHSPGACGQVPVLRLKTPAGSMWLESETDIYIPKSMLSSNKGTWTVDAWSDVSVSFSVKAIIDYISYQTIQSDTMTGIGTADGSGSECTNYQNYQKIGEFTVNDTGTYAVNGQFTYSGYNGKCNNLSVKVEDPDGSWFPAQYTGCPKPSGGSLCISGKTTGVQGTYKIWAWSDYAVNYTSKYYLYINVADPLVPTTTVSGGTCGGATCSSSTSLASCGNRTDWVQEGRCATPSCGDLDDFSVASGDYITGVKASITQSGYTGTCFYPYFRIRTPANSVIGTCASNCSPNPTGLPLAPGNYELEGWADEETGFTVKWWLNRLDAARRAAKNFIDNSDLVGQDRIGIISFSNIAKNEQGLTNDFEAAKQALNSPVPSDQTGLANAINAAKDMLSDESLTLSGASLGAGKFAIILTDGKANICTNGESCPESQAAEQAITAAETSRKNGITVYVIGFADSSISAYEDTLRQIAKHDDTNPLFDKCADTDQYCGKYYFAANEAQLNEIYSLVRGKINESFGLTKIEVPFPDGMKLVGEDEILAGTKNAGKTGTWDDETGTWQAGKFDTDLQWNPGTRMLSANAKPINYVSDNLWFAMQFDVVLPCDDSYCSLDYVVFPPQPTKIIDEDQTTVEWSASEEYCSTWSPEQPCTDKYLELPFTFKDIGINFVSGEIDGENILLNLKVENKGYANAELTQANPLKINFFNESEDWIESVPCGTGGCTLEPSQVNKDLPYNTAKLLGTVVPGLSLYGIEPDQLTLCATKPDTSGCSYGATMDTETTVENIAIPKSGNEGTIIAQIDHGFGQCTRNDTATIYCGTPKIKFFTIDYYAWVK